MELTQWNPMIDLGFWTKMAKKKIDQYKLESQPKPLIAKYKLPNRPDKNGSLNINAYSFGDTTDVELSGPVEHELVGKFLLLNTIEEYEAHNSSQTHQHLQKVQVSNLRRLINDKKVHQLAQIFMLVFGDFKKNLFRYRLYSIALSLKGFKRLSIAPACEAIPQQIGWLNIAIKAILKQGRFPQLSVLRSNMQISSFKQFIEAKKTQQFIFVVLDCNSHSETTSFHTMTALNAFSILLQDKLVPPDRLKSISILFIKEVLIYSDKVQYNFKQSQIAVYDFSQCTMGTFEEGLPFKRETTELDLKKFMDEKELAAEAVDLNIKLMKWRMVPSLDINKIYSKKVLLFGAGTLGCQLARNLIGWGVRNITFIDYSKISYSNPVRQSLYEYQDTLQGGLPKAETAAAKLIKIFPSINAKGYSIPVPMPGHFVTHQDHIKETFKNVDILDKLVQEHDVLFLLFDSREARWLPTVLACQYDKACITVGLGFDSYVVVRHGVPAHKFNPETHKHRLSCYFCNDVVTPQNTMKDRSLDQQCTVTRPGLSFMASALAAELYISLIHHPLEHHAPSSQNKQDMEKTILGVLPHHLRGNMSEFSTMTMLGKAFDRCVACSHYIEESYRANREEFLLKVLNDPSYIHDVVHLREQLEAAENDDMLVQVVFDEDEELEKQFAAASLQK